MYNAWLGVGIEEISKENSISYFFALAPPPRREHTFSIEIFFLRCAVWCLT